MELQDQTQLRMHQSLSMRRGHWCGSIVSLLCLFFATAATSAGEKITIDTEKRVKLPETNERRFPKSDGTSTPRSGEIPSVPYVPPSSDGRGLDAQKLEELLKKRKYWMLQDPQRSRDDAIREALRVRRYDLESEETSDERGTSRETNSKRDTDRDQGRSERVGQRERSRFDSTPESGPFGRPFQDAGEAFRSPSSASRPIRDFRLRGAGESEELSDLDSQAGSGAWSELDKFNKNRQLNGSGAWPRERDIESAERRLDRLFSTSVADFQSLSRSTDARDQKLDPVQQLLEINLLSSGSPLDLINNKPDRTREPLNPTTGIQFDSAPSLLNQIQSPIQRAGGGGGILDAFEPKTLGNSSLSPAIIVPSASRGVAPQPAVLELPKRRF